MHRQIGHDPHIVRTSANQGVETEAQPGIQLVLLEWRLSFRSTEQLPIDPQHPRRSLSSCAWGVLKQDRCKRLPNPVTPKEKQELLLQASMQIAALARKVELHSLDRSQPIPLDVIDRLLGKVRQQVSDIRV